MKRSFQVAAVLSIFWTLICLSGCSTLPDGKAQETSTVVECAIAEDFCRQLQQRFAPSETVFRIDRRASSRQFADALERSLRSAAYALAGETRSAGALEVVATLGFFDDEHLQAVVYVKGALQLTRLYTEAEGGAKIAASPFSCREEKRIPILGAAVPVSTPAAPGKREHAVATIQEAEQGRQEKPPRPTETSEVTTERKPVTERMTLVADSIASPGIRGDAALNTSSDDTIEVTPDREGVIELSSAIGRRREGQVPNPFLQEYRTKEASRDLSLAISGIALGPVPSVVINGRVYSVGDSLEGFSVVAIQSGVVRLRSDPFLLRLLVSDRPVTVKCL